MARFMIDLMDITHDISLSRINLPLLLAIRCPSHKLASPSFSQLRLIRRILHRCHFVANLHQSILISSSSNSASLELAEQSIPEGAQTIQAWLQRNRKNAKDAAHDEKMRSG